MLDGVVCLVDDVALTLVRIRYISTGDEEEQSEEDEDAEEEEEDDEEGDEAEDKGEFASKLVELSQPGLPTPSIHHHYHGQPPYRE